MVLRIVIVQGLGMCLGMAHRQFRESFGYVCQGALDQQSPLSFVLGTRFSQRR